MLPGPMGAEPIMRSKGVPTGLMPDRRAAAALEFAIVSVPFLGLVLGIAVTGLNLYSQVALDLALQTAVRQVQLGKVPSTYSAGDFASQVFCPALAPFIACTNLVVTLVPVANYDTAAVVAVPASAQLGHSGGFCTGLPGQLMFARVVYLAPVISSFWPYATQATVNGATGVALLSAAAFANENPSGLSSPATTGC